MKRRTNEMASRSQGNVFRNLGLKLLAGMMLAMGSLNAMGQNLNARVTVKCNTLEQAMNQIEKQSDLTFLLATNSVKPSMTICLDCTKLPVKDALQQLAEKAGVTYSIANRRVVLKDKPTEITAPQPKQIKENVIKGRVVDNAGEPIIGANVLEKGTQNGTITDADGNYTLRISPTGTLVVSYIGFKNKEVEASKGRLITMTEDTKSLKEVVVVGYGVQKKVNLTGAVSSVKLEDVLGNRPVSTVSEALQGALPGLQVTSTSGAPGEGMSFNIRGVNSINEGSPLVLVDNVEMDINMLDPNDIESVTVLKDAASSAIYGARAAFGVILVTTKKSNKSAFHINYTDNFAFSNAINIPKKATPLQTVQAYKDQGFTAYTTGQDVDTWLKLLREYEAKPASYPDGYAEVGGLRYSLAPTDLFKDMMETGFKQSHNLSMNGGSKQIAYRIGLGYVNQDGILYSNKDAFKRYNVSSYLSAEMTTWLKTELDIKYARSISSMPYTTAAYGIWGAAVAFPSYFPTGTLDLGGEILPINTPRNFISLAAPLQKKKNDARIFGKVTLTPVKDLHIIGEFTYNYKSVETQLFDKKFEYAHGAQFRKEQSVSDSKYQHVQDNIDYTALNLYATYAKALGAHNLSATAGFNQESNDDTYNMAYRTNMINEELPSLSQATGPYYAIDRFSRYTVRGLFYRLNYSYRDKYLIEANGRYDGSSKFPSRHRFGFFPSVSAGWRLGEERFMAWSNAFLSNLKLRVSWGNIGNQSIQPYAYIPGMLSERANWIVGEETATTLRAPKLISTSFTWEKVSTIDFGVDLGLFRNRFNLTFDLYNRKTKGMLAPGMELPSVLGAEAPLQNTADLSSNGWELSASWMDKIGNLTYHIGFNLYDSRTKITKYNNEIGLIGDKVYRKGMYLGEIWGYLTDRLYTTNDFKPDGTLKEGIARVEGYNPNPGDILYKDLDGNHVINHGKLTTDNPGDRTIIGNNTRRYQFGINGGVEWKNWALSFILQGVGKRDLWLMNELTYPIYDRWSTLYSSQLDYWTPTRTSSFFPRIYQNSEGNTKANTLVQSRFLKNGAYLSIRNITLTYAFPKQWVAKVGLYRASIFFSGENLFTFDHLPDGIDAERVVTEDMGARGFTYPYMRQFSFGVNITL